MPGDEVTHRIALKSPLEIIIYLPLRKSLVPSYHQIVTEPLFQDVEKALVHGVIRVDKSNPLSARHFKPQITCRTHSTIFFMPYPDTGILCGISVTNIPATIRTAVIYEQQLKITVRLLQDTIHTVSQSILGLIYRNNYRY